jgi:hypothetical protein
MKRFTSLALAFALFAPAAFVGCGEKAQTEIKQETPGGTTTETTEVKQTGDNPPPPASGAPAPAEGANP